MGTTENSRQVGGVAARGEDFHVRAGYRRSRIARHLWKTTALTTLALGLSGMAAHGDPNGLWQPQIRAIIGADNNGGNAALEGFIPLKQTAESVLFLDLRAKHDFKDSFGQDVGLGIRRIVNPDLMIGGYAYLNVENYNSSQFTSATLGAEAITPHFDAHVNVYLPIKGDHTDHSSSSTLSMVGNQLMEQISVLDHRDYAAWGIEGEIGAQVPINLPDKHSLRLDIGGYHFEDPHGDDGSVTGAKAGFEYTIGDVFGIGTELVLAGEVRNDNRDDTQFAGSVRLNIPFNPGHGSDNADDGADSGPEPVYPVSEGLRKRVNERVRGDVGVRIQSQTLSGGTTTRIAINAATNAAFGKFYYADGGLAGAGTLADPTTLDDAVAKSGANGFVVALGGSGNLTTDGATLADGQTVIGGGESVTAKLSGGGTGTFNLGGSDGTIQGTNVANNVITLGNGNTLNGITITGGADGILGNNITGATLTKVTVDGAGGNGADFTGSSTGITGSNFITTGNGLDGLHIDGDGTYNFTGTTSLLDNADDGLDITGKGTYTFAIVNAQDNADRGITVQGSGGTFTTTGGAISGNGGIGVLIDPITAHVVLDSISQTGGTSGVVLENVSGSFTVNGKTTISNTAGPAIAISDSPAAIRFGDVAISAPGGDGMSFAGVNAAVVAGNIVISGLGVGQAGLDFSGSKTNFTAQSLNITGPGAAGSIGIDLASPSAGGATIIITNGGSIAGVDTGVRFGISGSLANSANAEFTFGGGSIAGITASLDARGLNQTLGHYAFGSTTFSGAQLFDVQNVIFVGATATGTGSGSSLLDLASVATADANTDADAIFVLVNRGTAIDDADGFSLGAGQTLASFGNGRTFSLGGLPVNVTGDNVTHTGAISDAGGAATLTNSGAGDVVMLANNSSLLDFNVSGGSANGIYGSGVSNVTISGVSASGAGLNGVLFDGTNTVSGSNLNSSNNGAAGLSIQGDGAYAFGGTTMLSDNGDNGLFIVGDGTYAFQTLNASGNSGFGVNVLSTTGTFSTTDGTISGNGAAGVVLLGANIDVTLASLTQDGGGFGAMFAGVSGNFAVSGATTVSNTILDGIGIFDSTADFTFGAVDISDITAPGGIGIDVQNSGGAVAFGGPVTLTHVDSEGILAIGNAGAITFSGPVSMTDPGDGIWLEDNTGAVSFGGAVTIDQPFGNGIDVVGSNGTISFGDIDITGLCNCSTALDLSGSTSTFTAATLDVSGSSGGSSTGIDLSGTNGGSVTIGSGVITGVDTGVQLGTNGLAGTTANTAFSFGAAGGASISGVTASLDMRGLSPGSGTYAFNDTVLNGPQLFDIANVIYVGAANTGLGDGSSVNDLINATAADALAAPANTIFVLVNNGAGNIDTDADGFTLADGQSIVSFANGASVSLGSPPANVTGTNVVSGATQSDPFGFGAATLNNAAGNTIDLANGNVVENLTVSSSNRAIDGESSDGATINGVTISAATIGLLLDGTTGTVAVDNLTIQSASLTGIAIIGSSATFNFTGNTRITSALNTALFANNFDGTATFDDLDISGGGTGAAVVGGSSGTLTFGTGSSIAGTGSNAFSIGGGSTAKVTYNGTISQTSAASAVRITSLNGGGTATFGGKITASTGAANAIDLTGNAGATINFTGGLDLNTDGGYGLRAINGGTLTVTGSGNTVATGAGPDEKGILIGGTGMTIGAAGVTFSSVIVDGSGGGVSSGIVIENISTGSGNVTFGGVNINRVNSDAIRLTNIASGIYTFNGTTTLDTVVGGGPGFAVQGSAATVSVSNLVTTGVAGADVSLTNNTGSISILGGTITNSGTGDGVVVSGGSATIGVAANISSSATVPGTAVKVDGTTGGSVAFSGSVTSTGTGNLFAIGSSLPPVGGAISFTGSTLSATGGGGVVVVGLAGTATLNVTAPLSITNATTTGLAVANVASTASATFGAVTVTGAGADGIGIGNNAGSVTFGTTQITLGTTAGTAGINFALANADVTFGTTTVGNVGANQTGIDFGGSSTTADFGLTTITGTGDLTSRGIDLSSTTGNKVITFLQGSKIDNVGIGVDLSSGLSTATTANATFTFGDGDSTDGLESFIIAASGGYTVNTVGLDPTKGSYDFDDVSFTGSANLATAPGSVTMVSQSGGFIAAGTTGNLSTGVNSISLAAADALTGAQNFVFVGTIDLGATAFTLDSGQTIAGFGNSSVVSTGTIQPANVQGNLGASGGNITGDEAVVSGTANLMQLLGDNAVRNTAFDFSGATGAAFLIDQGAVGFSNASGITIEGVTIINVAVGQTAIKVAGLDGNLSVINNNINVAGTLLDVNGGTGTISMSRGLLPNAGPAGTLTGGGINIANRTGGSVTFTDQVTINGGGVAISAGSGAAAVNFNGGLAITASTATGLSLAGLNSLTVADAGTTTIDGTGQTALSLQGTLGAGGVHFDSVTSTNAGTQGVLISGASGGAVDLDAVTVTTSNGAGIEILNSAGTYTFGNTTIDNSQSFGRGVNIENAAGVTSATFDGTLAITTGTGTGLRVVGGATPANTSVSFTGAGIKIITAQAGEAVDITSANVNGTLTSTSATFGAGAGINLQNLTGSLNLGTGTLNNLGAGAAFNVGSGTDLSGGNADISYAGTIVSAGLGAAVSIQELTGGSVTLSGNLTDTNAAGGGNIVVANINNGTAATVNFSGATKQIQSGATAGVNLVGNTNGTIDFSNGGLAINTTSGVGFAAQAGGTISVAGTTNTITSTGNALSLNAVTVGSGINFNSVSTSGGVTTGIALTNVASSGGAVNLGTVDLQGISSRGVDVTGTLGAGLNFNSLSIGLTSTTAVGFDLNGAQINAAITANDFDVTNTIGAGTSIGVDLRGATGGQVVRLGDAVAGGASSSISGVNTGVYLDSATNLAFTYGDGESAIDQSSTIGATVGIDASSAPTLGTYNFQDVSFAASPGLGFGVGKVYFVGASATGDGTGRDQSNLATLSTAEAAAVTSDVLVLVNDGGTITAVGSNLNDTLVLATGEQVRGFGNGNINLAMSVPSTIQLANNNISIVDATADGAATLTTSAGSNAITLGASGNFIDGFILDGSPAGAARGIKDNGGGASGNIISHMTIRNFATAGVEITPSTSTAIDNVTFAGNASDVIVNALNTTITNVFSTGATGIAFDIRNTTGTTTLANLNVTTAATGTGIVFGGTPAGPGGTITGTNVDATGGAGGGIKVTGGNAAIAFDAASFAASTSGGTAVTIANRSGGSFAFAGSVVANGAANGISVSGATAANTVSFTGGVDFGSSLVLTGTAVSIDNNATASTVSFSNLAIATNGTTGFSASNGGTVNVTTGTVSSTGAQVVALNGVAAGVAFTSTNSSGGVNNVNLTNVTGTAGLGNGALSGATGTSFDVSGGSATVTYAGTITQATAGQRMIAIANTTGGAVNFTTAVANGLNNSATTGTGILIDGAAGNVTVNNASLTGARGITILGDALNNATGTFTFNSVAIQTAAGATNHAFVVDGDQGLPPNNDVSAVVNLNNVDITNPGGNVVNIQGMNGGSVTFDAASTITRTNNGLGILATSNGAGTITFGGATKTLTTGGNNAVSLTNNGGTAINFTNGGLAINTTNGTGFNAVSGGTVSVTGAGNSITTTSGVAVNLDTVVVAGGGVNFATTNKTLALGTNAVILDTVTGGAIDLGTGALLGGGGATIRIGDGAGGVNSGGTTGFSYAGTITSGTGRAVDIQDRAAGAGNITLSGNITHNVSGQIGIVLDDNAAGTITFSGMSKSITSTTSAGVTLTDNTGVTIDFTNGGLVIDTTSGIGFNATGGGTVTVQGTGNTITSTTGTALNVANTTIGASGLTFRSISANGGTNGIVLNTTGLAAGNGGLTVTGTGVTAGSGGTIQNTVQGALFTSTKNLSLSNMNFTNANSGNGTLNNVDGPTFNSAAQAAINMSGVATAAFANLNLNGGVQVGINGQNVSNLTIANTTVTGFGDAVFEGGMRFYNLTGTSSITNSTFSFTAGAGGDNLVDIRNDAGTSLTLNIAGSTFSNTKLSANGAQGLNFEAFSSANATLNISNSNFLSLKTSGVEAFARDTSTLNVNITDGGTVSNGNTFDPQGGLGRAIGLNAEDTAHLNFKILNNKKIYGNGGPVINVFGINNAVIMGRINNNADIQGGGVGSAGSPIYIHPEDASTGVVEIIGNTITKSGNDPAILAIAHGDGAGPSADNGSLDLTIRNNNITLSGTGSAGNGAVGIDVRSGAANGELSSVYLNIANNAVTLAQPADDIAFLTREGSNTSHLYFQNFAGGANNQAIATAVWNAGGNTPIGSVFSFDAGGALAYTAIPGGHNGGLVLVPTN
ncbi:hypothetical protein NKI38_19585 [Mesorhizobium sp. M0621]|uniref:inverse autotransporter beta domain-containing protein n=1 Tax=Mesorhizobium sp. M0621 TaxID=2956974 RepID=UPI00333DB7B5